MSVAFYTKITSNYKKQMLGGLLTKKTQTPVAFALCFEIFPVRCYEFNFLTPPIKKSAPCIIL